MSKSSKNFDEIVEEQNWSEQTMLFLLRQFIADCGMHEELDTFAQEQLEGEKWEIQR